jgi:two-component system nitrate/nitrite response regulator NarL
MTNTLEKVEVLVVAKHELVREALKRILDDHCFSVQSSAPDRADSSRMRQGDRQQLIIVDAATAEEGIDTCSLLRAAFPAARLVLMADEYDVPTIARSLAVGIDGYLGKAIACETLIGALRLVLLGEKVVPSRTIMSLTTISQRVDISSWDHDRLAANLSDREVEILQRLVIGEANKVISLRLSISEATVKVHVKAVLRKLRVMNRTQAAIWAVNRGLVPGTGTGPATRRTGTTASQQCAY